MVKKGLILDSNIAIGLLNDNKKVVGTIQSLHKDGYEFYFSVITLCELMSGAKTENEIQAIRNIEYNRFIDVNMEIAAIAGEIRLKQKKEENRAVKAPDSLIIATSS
ncbi:PIN domain-containing protein [Fodinisporobacter ferrooxydans]|uniref:PIN domain-containing protein n=1 Tax=Fodinisporobacter ferrooxydans TaxID=2901836 RepID=A0ABY4CM82_9BACL|nr:PIN domain-containing protein [Alicyclobacillaceae bacterium MYW30-H2]